MRSPNKQCFFITWFSYLRTLRGFLAPTELLCVSTRQGMRQELLAIKHGLWVEEISTHHTDKGHKGLAVGWGNADVTYILLI